MPDSWLPEIVNDRTLGNNESVYMAYEHINELLEMIDEIVDFACISDEAQILVDQAAKPLRTLSLALYDAIAVLEKRHTRHKSL